jgi:hypothetical protein
MYLRVKVKIACERKDNDIFTELCICNRGCGSRRQSSIQIRCSSLIVKSFAIMHFANLLVWGSNFNLGAFSMMSFLRNQRHDDQENEPMGMLTNIEDLGEETIIGGLSLEQEADKLDIINEKA